ncbi:type II toxin-antitoxin system HipA family toxin [bacterium]|nr:type II toxin-antitoxin system HipA family toxin [bacterium]
MIKKPFDIYLNTKTLGLLLMAECVLEQDEGLLTRVGFRYRQEYLTTEGAFAVDPVGLPLTNRDYVIECRQGLPAFLDDYLPDAWGRKVIAKLMFYKKRQRIDPGSVIDILNCLGGNRIGALNIVPKGQQPAYTLGECYDQLPSAEKMVQAIEQDSMQVVDELGLLYLANSGTGVGGARPKALIYDDKPYLAKFNRLTFDQYNNARVELACLFMAKAAGLNVGHGKILSINNREALLLERFDIEHQYRHHLITVNALIKNPTSQRDGGGLFRYDDIVVLLRRYSIHVEQDLVHLLSLMLFNRAIHNTDDHERNFSFIHRGEGYQLAPAYDMVPSVVAGQYHVAGFGYSPYPPTLKEAKRLGRIFNLPKS